MSYQNLNLEKSEQIAVVTVHRPETLNAINNLSRVLRKLGKLDEAEKLGREAVELANRVHAAPR